MILLWYSWGIAPRLAGNTKEAYMFAIARGSDEITGEVGLWIVDGGVEGVVWGWDFWGNVDELGDAEVITKIFDVPSEVSSNCMEYRKFLSRCEVTN